MTIPGDITLTVLSDLNGPSPQFTLTCISTGGPATTVTWTRDSTTVIEGTETMLDDPETSQYTHTLTVVGRLLGIYVCTVANNKPSSASASFTLQGIDSTHIPHCQLKLNYSVWLLSLLWSIVDSEAHYCCVVIGVFPISSTVPSAPILTVTVTSTTITITGSVPSVSVVTGFEVEWQRDTSVGCSDVNQDTMSVTGPFTSYTITGLEPGNSYLVSVRVYNSLGSAPASTVSAMTEEAGERQKVEREICRGRERLTEAVCVCVCEREREREREGG